MFAFRPFQLNPNMPADGKEHRAYMAGKFGGPQRAQRQYRSLERAAHAEGLEIRFELIGRAPNTL